MAYTIKLGQFAKNIESTAQPNTTGWAEHSVTLKNGADISNPRIELQVSWEDIKDVNYAVMMNRYYWVIGKNMLRENLCQLSLRVDVLATYKTEIGSSSLYILRSSAASDGTISDNLYPIKAQLTPYEDFWPSPPTSHKYENGVFVLNIAGSQTVGASTLIQLSPPSFRLLIQKLYEALDGFSLGDIIPSVVKFFGGNPEKLINSAIWFPTKFTSVVSASDVYIGNWHPGMSIPGYTPITIPCEIIKDPEQVVDYASFTVRKHPQAATRGSYLNLAPYSKYTIYVPGAGAAQLDTSELLNSNAIYCVREVDALTGKMVVTVTSVPIDAQEDVHILAKLTGQYGVEFPLKGSNSGSSVVNGMLTTLGSIGAAIATGGAGIGVAAASIGTIANAISGATVNSAGVSGILAELNRPIYFDTSFYEIVDEDNARRGRPLCQITTPATLGGFMIADKGDVVMAGPLPEHEEVKRYLETGFFYE